MFLYMQDRKENNTLIPANSIARRTRAMDLTLIFRPKQCLAISFIEPIDGYKPSPTLKAKENGILLLT